MKVKISPSRLCGEKLHRRNTDTKYFEGSAEDMAVQFVDMLANEHLV